eukprot:scaffold1496_cov110-Isochrysis_galbana.AAC.6
MPIGTPAASGAVAGGGSVAVRSATTRCGLCSSLYRRQVLAARAAHDVYFGLRSRRSAADASAGTNLRCSRCGSGAALEVRHRY